MTELGVYVIRHANSGYFYIGSTSDIDERSRTHYSRLTTGKHHVKKFNELYQQSPTFSISFMPFDSISEAMLEEIRLIDFFKKDPLCLNTLHTQRGPSMETRVKIGNANRGRTGLVRSVETRQKIAKARTGVRHTDETKRKVSEANKGRKMNRTAEHCANISKALMKSVSIDGVIYNSTGEAATALGCAQSTVMYRIQSNSPKFSEWKLH